MSARIVLITTFRDYIRIFDALRHLPGHLLVPQLTPHPIHGDWLEEVFRACNKRMDYQLNALLLSSPFDVSTVGT